MYIRDNFTEAQFESMLIRERNKRTKRTNLPSEHLQAWRDYERQQFAYMGRNPAPRNLGYNLYTNSARVLDAAHGMVTDQWRREASGFSAKRAPRQALALMSESIGCRYMRGLDVIAHKLKGDAAAEFHAGRQVFRHKFETDADAAHRANDEGHHPEMVLAVVKLYAGELLALCPWLETTGAKHQADMLRSAVAGLL